MQTTQGWLKLVHEMGHEFEGRSAKHDSNDSFVSDDYATLKANGFLGAAIPEEFGGGGVSHSLMCDLLRILGQYSGSTALAQSMHQHLVGASIWKYQHGQAGPEILKKVAAKQLVLISTEARLLQICLSQLNGTALVPAGPHIHYSQRAEVKTGCLRLCA